MNLKGTLIACITFLVGIVVIITYVSQKERYLLYPLGNSLYIFDSKTATLNYCNDKNCQMVAPQGGMMDPSYASYGGPMALPNQTAVIMAAPAMPAYPQMQPVMNQGSLPQPMPAPSAPIFGGPAQQPMVMVMPQPRAMPVCASPGAAAPSAASAAANNADAGDAESAEAPAADAGGDAGSAQPAEGGDAA
jgi:hypothetical protein